MNIVIYRKSDLVCVGAPVEGMTIEQEIELNVIPNFGGVQEDYAYIETEEQFFRLERIDGVVTVIAQPVIPPIEAPSEIDLLGQQLVEKELQILELQQENQVLGQQLVDIDLRLLMGGL